MTWSGFVIATIYTKDDLLKVEILWILDIAANAASNKQFDNNSFIGPPLNYQSKQSLILWKRCWATELGRGANITWKLGGDYRSV